MTTDEELLNPSAAPQAAPPAPDDAWLDALIAQSVAAEPDDPTQTAAAEDPLEKLHRLFGQRPASGPGEAERAYLAGHPAPSGSRVGATVATALSTLFGGNADYGAQQDARRLQHQQGLEGARTQDRTRAPVDLGTAEMLLKAGLTPEAANATRGDSRALALGNNLGMIDTRQRGQDLQAQQKQQHDDFLLTLAGLNNTSREGMNDKRISSNENIAGGRNDTAIKVAGIRAKKGAGTGAPQTPEEKAAKEKQDADRLVEHIYGQTNVPRDKVRAILMGGDTSNITPDEAAAVQGKAAIFSGLDRKEQGRLLIATEGREGSNLDAAGKAAAVQGANVEKKRQVRDDLLADKAVLSDAISGWKGLTPKAQAALVQYGGIAPSEIMSALKSAGLSEKEQVAAARVQRLVNSDIKRISGSAVTASEGGRQGTAIGMAAGDFNPWQSSAVLTDYLRNARGVLDGRWQSAETAYPDLWEGMK